MIRYGKTAQNAISAMSRLAEVYDEGKTRLSSMDIAQRRNLPKPIVAKMLVVLSQAGLVKGAPGPNGGYSLARHPSKISLFDIVSLFERSEDRLQCPFGPDWCGNNDPCPLHDDLYEMDQRLTHFLENTRLDVFAEHAGKRP